MSMMSVEIFEQMRHNMVEKSLYFSSTQLELHFMESFFVKTRRKWTSDENIQI